MDLSNIRDLGQGHHRDIGAVGPTFHEYWAQSVCSVWELWRWRGAQITARENPGSYQFPGLGAPHLLNTI